MSWKVEPERWKDWADESIARGPSEAVDEFDEQLSNQLSVPETRASGDDEPANPEGTSPSGGAQPVSKVESGELEVPTAERTDNVSSSGERASVSGEFESTVSGEFDIPEPPRAPDTGRRGPSIRVSGAVARRETNAPETGLRVEVESPSGGPSGLDVELQRQPGGAKAGTDDAAVEEIDVDAGTSSGAVEEVDEDMGDTRGGEDGQGMFIPSLTRSSPPGPSDAEQNAEEQGEELVPDEVIEAVPEEDVAEAEEPSVELDAEDIELEAEAVEEVQDAPRPSPPPPVDSKPRKPWYDEVFGEHFEALIRRDPEVSSERDVDFILDCVPLEQGASILDVGFGQGHHCFVFAGRRFSVTGIDSSLTQVFRVSEAKDKHEGDLTFLHGDMRDIPTEERFDLVTCLGTTFGYFDRDGNIQALRQLRDRITDGGKLVLQVFNRDHLVSRLPARSWWQGKGCMVIDEAGMDYFTNRLHVHRTVAFEDGRQYDHRIDMQAFSLHDLLELLEEAGLRVLEVSGSRETRGRFYGATSPDIWVVAAPRT